MSSIETAVERAGLRAIADACGVSYQAVQRWVRNGALPRTEWTGETNYAEAIAAIPAADVTVDDLCPGLSVVNARRAAA